jgi:hypothetical protein
VDANGEYERIIHGKLVSTLFKSSSHSWLGCFENYLRVRYHDHALRKPNIMADWFHWFEKMYHHASAQYHNELYGYLAYPIIAVHPLFAGSIYQRIEYPRAFYEASNELGIYAHRLTL